MFVIVLDVLGVGLKRREYVCFMVVTKKQA